jgi:hypothetical protein
MNKKERPKIYQHTSGGGHELIHNNPSPKEALEQIKLLKDDIKEANYIELGRDKNGIIPMGNGKEHLLNHVRLIELYNGKALTNYANMVEMLEGLVKHCDKSIEVYKDSYNGVVSHTMKSMKEKLTKVLEGKI